MDQREALDNLLSLMTNDLGLFLRVDSIMDNLNTVSLIEISANVALFYTLPGPTL